MFDPKIAGLNRAKLVVVQLMATSYSALSHWISTAYARNDAQSVAFILIRIAILVLAVRMFFRIPPVGFGVALLAVAAACMSLHEHQTLPDKATWMFLIILLLGVEARSILSAQQKENNRLTQEREAQNREFLDLRKMQNETFLATMNGINQSIGESQSHFIKTIDVANALLEKSDDLQRRSMENLNATTGGDSFAYVLFTPWGVPPYLKAQGKYPLHDLRIQFLFMDIQKGFVSPMMEYKQGALGVGQLIQLFAIHFNLPDNDHWKVFTYFDALNGHWAQETELQKNRVNDWSQSFKVRRDDGHGKFEVIYDSEASNK
jgi:hypothetical protein